ncbi:MAG: terminase large subunit [Neisseriaceae bacterium]|nr:terminase large subunit [Neisseriaceae bacterium]
MEWTTACPDWEERIVRGESLIPMEPLFPIVSEIARDVFGELIVPDMNGRPKMKDVMPDWVMDWVGSIFGALDPDSRRRLIKDFFLLISKKNAKSTVAAGIMITALELNDRDLAEAIILAPTKQVADNAFKPAMGMILFDDDMKEKYTVYPHVRTITHIATQSTLKVLAADDKTAGGAKASYVLIDELHLFGKVATAESIISEATGGLISHADGFIIKLSTQSTEPPSGVFLNELLYARSVRDGLIENKTYLPVLYEFPRKMLDDESYKDSRNFHITNPNMGYSVDEEYLLSKYSKEEAKGETSLQEFCAKHLNVEIGLNLRSSRWPGVDFWEAQKYRSVLTLEELIARSEVITIGGDGGGLDDLLGMAVLGREKGTRDWLLWVHAWCHKKVLEIRKQIAPQLLDYQRQGDLTIVDQSGDDCDEFGKICGQVYESGLLDKIGLDPLMVGGLIDGIIDAGVPEELIVGVAQGYKLAGYIQTTERKLASGQLFHSGQPMMAWCVGNAKVEVKGNNALITKQSSGKSKIDPLIAAFNAVGLMSLNPESKGRMDDFINDMIMVGI